MPTCPPQEELERLASKTPGPDDEFSLTSHFEVCATCREPVAALSRPGPTLRLPNHRTLSPAPGRPKPRYFSGLTIDQAADVLHTSPRTAKRHWTYARAWLLSEMGHGD